MATLESLPADIKLLLLLDLSDYYTLSSLTTVSRGFFKAYLESKDKILAKILVDDATTKHAEESLFLARRLPELRGTTVKHAYTEDIAKPFYSPEYGESSDVNNELWYCGQLLDGKEEEVHGLIVENHKLIVKHAAWFIADKRYPLLMTKNSKKRKQHLKNGRAATDREFDRVVRGFYRLWILSLLYSAKVEVPGDIAFRLVMKALDFWDVKVLQALLGYLREKLSPLIAYLQPAQELVELYFRSSKEYINAHLGVFMANDFPYNTGLWLQAAKSIAMETQEEDPLNPGLLEIYANRAKDIMRATKTNRVSSFTRDIVEQYQLFHSTRLASKIFEFHIHDKIGGKPAELITGDEISSELQLIPMKRVCSPIRTEVNPRYHLPKWPDIARTTWLVVELSDMESKGTDYFACVWDDERLKEWGYEFPRFEREWYNPRRGADEAMRIWKKGSEALGKKGILKKRNFSI